MKSAASRGEANNGVLFGVGLKEVMQRPGESSIPSVLKQMVAYLSELGPNEPLFRQPANTKELQDLRYQLNKGGRVDYESKPKPELVAALLKVYLRELPEPLLTFSLYSSFLTASEESDEKKRAAALSELLAQLPKTNRLLVELIIKFLARLCVHADANHVSPVFLAHIFTHIFLRPRYETIETMVQLPKAINLMQILIETDHELLFPRSGSATAAALKSSSGSTATTASRSAVSKLAESPVVSRPLPDASEASLRSATSATAPAPAAGGPTSPPIRRAQSPGGGGTDAQPPEPTPAPAALARPVSPPPQVVAPSIKSPRGEVSGSSSPEIDNKVAHLKATVQEALQTLRKDLDDLEQELSKATSADKVIDIARLVRATKKALDGRENDS